MADAATANSGERRRAAVPRDGREPERRGEGPRARSLLALIRLVLAASAALVFAVAGTRRTATAWGLALAVVYAVYAAALYLAAERGNRLARAGWLHWADVGWYTALIMPSGGLDSALFPFYFFPIMAASLSGGFAEAMRVAAACAALAAGAAALPLLHGARPGPATAPLTHALLLLVVGHLIAQWGGKELEHRRRLALLGAIMRLPNPRLGPQQVMAHCLEHVRAHFGAESCVAVMRMQEGPSLLFLADGDRTPVAGREIDAAMSDALLGAPTASFVHCRGETIELDPWSGGGAAPEAARAAAIAELLEAPCYACVPLLRLGSDTGRLYVVRRDRGFSADDGAFLRDLAAHVAPMIENINVLDRIASDATLHEREKISRDLHDSTIQPYIGLKLGLEALRRRAGTGAPAGELADELDDLIAMTGEGIAELRRYVGGLRDRDLPRETSLVHAIWRVAEKYRDYYGIDVAVNVDADLGLNDRLAAEVFQIVNEGLSNVRRHTASRRVTLNVRRQSTELVLQVINHVAADGRVCAAFRPRSIVERVQHLGGRVDVALQADGGAVVTAEIPL